ncbi:lipopolysaccharide kinase InaA family protein [Echinicola sp. 20G]|uniref:lipopolysaccharide kinase InaA family protein n=1 Tax=Echinicola sp. 20G TaxID=2781961 RepID=UPI0019104021|nr:lipopolysaccharide kinase InaA family protein [Echinicola sp. 20G]
MKKIIHIHDQFKHLRKYLEEIPEKFEERGTVIYNERNQVRTDMVRGEKIVVKSFRKIYLANRFIYAYLRPSKAKRAYEYALMLQQEGINTPQPVAFIDCIEKGMLKAGYFVSVYTDYKPLSSFDTHDVAKSREMLESLARFTLNLHLHKIYHEDYTLGNILYHEQNGQYDFALIDNNRLKQIRISESDAVKSLNRLGFQPEAMTYLIRRYMELRGTNALKGLKLFYDYKYEASLRYGAKTRLKKLRDQFLGKRRLGNHC